MHTFEIDPELRRGMLTDADEELMMLWHEENEAVDECAASDAATREACESASRSPSLLSSASASAGSSPAKRSNAADDERQERAAGEGVCSSCSAQGLPAAAAAQRTMELGDAAAAEDEDGAFLGVEDDGLVCESDGDGEKLLDGRAVGSWDEGRRGCHVSGFHLSDLFHASLESPAHGREGTRRTGACGTGDSGEGLAEEETAVDWTCESEANLSFSPLHVPSSSLHSFLRTTTKWGVSRSEEWGGGVGVGGERGAQSSCLQKEEVEWRQGDAAVAAVEGVGGGTDGRVLCRLASELVPLDRFASFTKVAGTTISSLLVLKYLRSARMPQCCGECPDARSADESKHAEQSHSRLPLRHLPPSHPPLCPPPRLLHGSRRVRSPLPPSCCPQEHVSSSSCLLPSRACVLFLLPPALKSMCPLPPASCPQEHVSHMSLNTHSH